MTGLIPSLLAVMHSAHNSKPYLISAKELLEAKLSKYVPEIRNTLCLNCSQMYRVCVAQSDSRPTWDGASKNGENKCAKKGARTRNHALQEIISSTIAN